MSSTSCHIVINIQRKEMPCYKSYQLQLNITEFIQLENIAQITKLMDSVHRSGTFFGKILNGGTQYIEDKINK